jgi:MFS family permease
MIPHVSVRAVVDDGIVAGWLPADAHDRGRAALVQAAREDTPWYLRVLIGGAAWFTASFLLGAVLGLVALALGDRVDAAAILLGLGMMPAGVWLRMEARNELSRQFALVLVMCGQVLLVGGLGAISESTTVAAGVVVVTCVVLIVVFDDAVYRFGATLTAIGAGLVLAFDWHVPYALGLATAVVACLPLIVWRVPALQAVHRVLDPVAWASAVGLCALLTTQTIIDAVTGPAGQPPEFLRLLMPTPWPLAALFVGLQVWLALQVAREHDVAPTDPAPIGAIAAIVTIGLLTLSTPAISGALLLMVLAFDRRRTGLFGLAAAFLVGFLGLYYYSLAMTLLQKSGILLASGTVCLAAAAFFHAQAKKVAA